MGQPVTGAWRQRTILPYADASKWGTGANPVHQYYGSANLRVTGRNGPEPDITPPALGQSEYIKEDQAWGYEPEDFAGTDVVANEQYAIYGVPFTQDDWPRVGDSIEQRRGDIRETESAPWNAPNRVKNWLRGINNAAGNPDQLNNMTYGTPTEDVAQGWVNKAASGMGDGFVSDSEPAGNDQVFVQTSMTQRYKKQDNNRSQLRGTDDSRSEIPSRIAPMKVKRYSEGERLYDMAPREADVIPRPFAYRNAGVGREWEMDPNEMFVQGTISRSPTPDPSIGTTDIDIEDGYTAEDTGWY